MAYINAEKVRSIRNELKAVFPEFKFSVRNENHLAINVTIVKGPIRFSDNPDAQINNYHPDNYENADILKIMLQIINRGNYDRSDAQSDYFDVGWYVHFNQGKWDKPYEVVGELPKNYLSVVKERFDMVSLLVNLAT